jgi:hypothetical protein
MQGKKCYHGDTNAEEVNHVSAWNLDEVARLQIDEARRQARRSLPVSSYRCGTDPSRKAKLTARVASLRDRLSD